MTVLTIPKEVDFPFGVEAIEKQLEQAKEIEKITIL